MAATGLSVGIVVLSTGQQVSTGLLRPFLIKSVGSNSGQDFSLVDGNGHAVFRGRGQREVYLFGKKQFDRLSVASALGASHWIYIYLE